MASFVLIESGIGTNSFDFTDVLGTEWEDHEDDCEFFCLVAPTGICKTAKEHRNKLRVQGNDVILITHHTMGARGLFVRDVFGIGPGKDIIVGTADTDVDIFSGLYL